MKSILLLSSSMKRRDWGRAQRIYDNFETKAFILTYDWYFCPPARNFDAKLEFLEEYLPQSERDNINKLATEWGTTWYLEPGVASKMTWDSINLGNVIQYPWHFTLNAILRLCYIINRLIDEQKPDQLELFYRNWKPTSFDSYKTHNDPLLEHVAMHVALQRGLKVVNHAGATFIDNSVNQIRSTAKKVLGSAIHEARKVVGRLDVSHDNPCGNKKEGGEHRALFVNSARSIVETVCAFQEVGGGDSLCVGSARQPNLSKELYKDIMQSTPLKISSVSRRAAGFFRDQSPGICSSFEESRFFTYCGSDLFPIVKLWIKYLMQEEFPRLAMNIEATKRILLAYSPNVVISDNSMLELPRIFFLVARKQRILTIELQHGLLTNTTPMSHPKYFISHKHIMWGQLDRDKQISLKADPSRFSLGGNPRFDSHYELLDELNNKNCSNQKPLRVGVTFDICYKFYGITGWHNTIETILSRYIRCITQVARKMPGVIFSFKPKQYPASTLLLEAIQENGIENYEIVGENIKLEGWLSGLSSLVTDYSTMALEAMIFDVPVVILNMTSWDDPVGLETSGAVDVAQSAEQLYKALSDNIINSERRAKQRKEFLRYALEDTAGSAATKTAKLIVELIQEHKV